MDQTVIAREDRLEGNVTAHRSIHVLGQVQGKLEAPSVVIEEGAKVNADVSADEVVVAGEYTGNLVSRQRLEVRSTGKISGRLEYLKLMLHEGAAVDGELKVIKPAPPVEEPPVRGGQSVRSGSVDVSPRSAGEGTSHSAATETSVRQPVGPGAETV